MPPTPPSSTSIDDAIVAWLAADAELLALMPDGVWYKRAPQAARAFVIVSLIDSFDRPVFGGRAFEDALYLIKAVHLDTSRVTVDHAADRIDALLEDTRAITVPGFTLITTHRDERIDEMETDEGNADLVWQHVGGRYRVQFAIAAP